MMQENMNTIDCYEVLQLSRDVTGDEIKKAFRRLAMRFHPDLDPAYEEAEENHNRHPGSSRGGSLPARTVVQL
jgi:curved DNA-binding protein CbpA